MTDRLKFEEEEIQISSFKLLQENNAMLRMMLHNQFKIMEKLGIENGFPESIKSIADSLIPSKPVSELDHNPLITEAVEALSQLIQKRAWEWAKMNS